MLPLRKLIQLWSNDRFVPGGDPVTQALPTSDEERKTRLLEMNRDSTIVEDFRDGIALLSNAIEGLEITQRFNQDPSSFRGHTQEVLMSHDYLLLAHVLRLIFPEGMMSELRSRKRALDERDSIVDFKENIHNTEYRSFLTPKGPSQRIQQKHTGFFAAQGEPGQKQVFGFSGFSTQSPTPTGGFFKSFRGGQEAPGTVFGSSGFGSQLSTPTNKLLESINEGGEPELKRKLPDSFEASDIQSQASFMSAFSDVSLTSQKKTPDEKRVKLV
jgi:hypothetical protein